MPKHDIGELITALNDAVNKLNNLRTKYDDLEKENARLREVLLRWIAADDEGDGHECIHALADARKLVGETQ
jgi:hypothetical protein